MTEIVHLTRFSTKLGPMSLASTERGIVACSLPGGDDNVPQVLARALPEARVVHGTGRNAPTVAAVRAYLSGRRATLDDVRLDLRGTAFQKKVWAALRRVPAGRTISYGELARRAGHPRAARACGSANGSNPVPLFVPCHRTIAADGSLGGFGGGLPLKRRLLDLEARGARAGARAGTRGAAAR